MTSSLLITSLWHCAGSRRWRACGKLFAASLLRHLWDGRILVRRSFEEPLFAVERVALREEMLIGTRDAGSAMDIPLGRKVRRPQLEALSGEDPDGLDWVVLADADCVVLRNLDHLFAREEDLLISRGAKGPDPGFVAIRAASAREFGERLLQGGGLDSATLEVVIAEGVWKVGEFERGEVLRPGDPGVTLEDLANAAVVHFSGMKPEDKQRLAFALHMMAVYGDKDGLFLDMLEA